MGFRSLLKAFYATSRQTESRYENGENADLICDKSGALWTRDTAAPIMVAARPPFDVLWRGQVVDTEIEYPNSNTVYQIIAEITALNGPWTSNPAYLLMAYESLVGGAVPIFSVPIPDGPAFLNISFTPAFYNSPVNDGSMFVAISSTPETFTSSLRVAFINIAGGRSDPVPP